MQLFNRIVNLKASPTRFVPWATEIANLVNAETGLAMSCWLAQFGAPLGSLAFTALAPAESELAAASAKLSTHAGYLGLVERGMDMDATAEDRLWTVVHGSRPGPSPVGSIGLMTTATAALDRYADAVRWGVEVAQIAGSITGSPVAVMTGSYGAIGSMAWATTAPDLATHEAQGAKVRANPEYLEAMKGSRGLFLPGSGHIVRAVKLV